MSGGPADALKEDAVRRLRQDAFVSARGGHATEVIGVEAEFIPVDALTRRICSVAPACGSPTATPSGSSSLAMVRGVAARLGWSERRSAKGVPAFVTPEHGVLTFEPGGQIELASPALTSASRVLDWLQRVAQALRAQALRRGIDLLAVGIDPENRIAQVPLQLSAPRYLAMDAHFARIGPAGARMMRQTAAVQVSVDAGTGDELWERWHVLNAAAPYFTAMFANSPRYAGADTGHQSFRAHTWRHTDAARTGLPFDAHDPVGRYADFALDATVISAMLPPVEPAEQACREGHHVAPTARALAARGTLSDAVWTDHLSTLFPEVRPRGFLEVRSIDALAPEWYPAVVAVVGGLVRAPRARRDALALLPTPSDEALCTAGRLGLRDAQHAATAAALIEIALNGCAELGTGFLEPRHVEVAQAFAAQFTRQGRSPADDIAGRRAAHPAGNRAADPARPEAGDAVTPPTSG